MISFKKLTPLTIMILGFIGVIVVGTMLLFMPVSHAPSEKLSFIDSLFIATSAVCVTGLSPVEVGTTLSIFGKVILALLLEVGAMGFVTITIFVLVVVGKKIGFQNRVLIKEALNQNTNEGLVRLVKFIFTTTLIIQSIGTMLLLFVFVPEYGFWPGLGHSAFHAISSFNNAGFDILGTGEMQSVVVYANHLGFNIVTAILIFLGGIGFIVLYDVYTKKSIKNLSTHSKIVLKMSFILIIVGTVILYLTERGNLTFLQAFFQSTSARTAGLSTAHVGSFKNATLILLLLFMFIGASPNSCGGGIKTTTFYTIIKSIYSFATGKQCVTHKRQISDKSIIKAFTLAILAVLFIFIIIFLVAMIEHSLSLQLIVFEVVSAFGTVGYSLGTTPLLSSVSKIVISVTMFVGRLGPIAIFSVWNKNWNKMFKTSTVDYIEERMIIG